MGPRSFAADDIDRYLAVVPAVFVHGVPETADVWTRLIGLLERTDVIALRLPGFGSPLPAASPTMDFYADWLAEALSGFEKVDLVAHDWGGLLALRVLSDRPSNIRSWALDSPDLSADFAWHSGALAWQRPGGKQLADWLSGSSLDGRVEALRNLGVDAAAAPGMATAIDVPMTTAMLALYRSAVDIGPKWGPQLDQITAPGLCIEAALDEFRADGVVRNLAERLDASLLTISDAGHFWMLDSPKLVATELEAFWHRVIRRVPET
jgi:pimeloyl-ACP methyl ester carboxylesterase